VIDEAAAIPLKVLKPMVLSTQATTIISSTIHGYEGTGRSLSLKLIEGLRNQKSNGSG
jgi:N-acetyltransferase 10